MKPLTENDFHTFADNDGCDTISCKEHLMKQILNNQEMIKRLVELGYVLSKFGKDKTYSQTEMMDVFQAIIEGDEDEELTEEELKAVKEAEADYKAGRVYTHEELGKKLGLDEGKK